MLSQLEALQYLVHQKMIDPRRVVEGDLLIIDASRRNRNYKIICQGIPGSQGIPGYQDGPGYLFKQGSTPDGRKMVAHEAATYQLLHAAANREAREPVLPRLYLYDEGEGILILELLNRAEDMGERQARLGRFSVALAMELGKALGWLHRQPGAEVFPGDPAQHIHSHPWVLSLHRPNLEVYRKISNANLELIKIIQKYAGFCELLDELRAGWRPEALMHGDIKFANCAVIPGLTAARRPRLKIIDWESAQPGDPDWDAGSVFSDYLATWLCSIPVTGALPPQRFPELARLPLGRMQPAMRGFWAAYIERMGFNRSTASEHLQRSVRYCAARLIQATYELMQAETQVTGVAVIALQLSFNILQQPSQAAAQLLGLPVEAERRR